MPARSFLLGISTALFLLVFTSCNNNTCAGFDCQNGECESGACVCDDGFEGPSCNNEWSEKFVGSYEGTDCYDAGNATYTVNRTHADTIIYDNKYKAYIKEGTQLVFPDQDAELDGAEFIFSGSGVIDGDKLDLLLFSKYPNFEVKCELSLERVN